MNPETELNERIRAALADLDYPSLHEACTELLSLRPDASAAVEGLALCAMESKNFEAAVACYSRLVRLLPNEPNRWFNLGVACLEAGDGVGAVQAWRETIRLQPDHQGAWINIGKYCWSVDDLPAAREAWEQATRRGDCPEALFNLGLLAEREGDNETARRLFSESVCCAGHVPSEAWFRVGCLRLEAGDAKGSVQALMEALHDRPDWVEALLNAGLANWQAGDRNAAMASFRHALRYVPESKIALQALAALAVERGDYEQALDCQARLARAGENSPEFNYNTGLMLQRMGQTADAEQLYRRSLEQNPGFTEALINLGHVLAARGDEAAARECWAQKLA